MRRVHALSSLFPLLLSLSLALFNSVPSAAAPGPAAPSGPASLAPPQSAAQPPGATSPGAPVPLTIPLGRTPTIDGNCSVDQYIDAVALTYADAFGKTGTAYVKHDNVNLYICLQAVAGQFSNRFATVYLDTFHDDA